MHKSNNIIQNKWLENMSKVKYKDEQGVKNIHTRKNSHSFIFFGCFSSFFCFAFLCLACRLHLVFSSLFTSAQAFFSQKTQKK